MKANSAMEQNFEFDEGYSEISASVFPKQQEISKIYSSNLEQAYKMINECSETSKKYHSRLLVLQQQNREISSENLELKQKLQQLEKESKKAMKEGSSKLKEVNESSKISTFWQYDSIMESEMSYELEAKHNNTVVSQQSCKITTRKASYPVLKPPKKRPVLKTALIKSVFFNF